MNPAWIYQAYTMKKLRKENLALEKIIQQTRISHIILVTIIIINIIYNHNQKNYNWMWYEDSGLQTTNRYHMRMGKKSCWQIQNS